MSVSPPSRPPARPGLGDGSSEPTPGLDDDPDAPPSAEELEAARALAEALEGRSDGTGPGAAFAGALRAAYDPGALDPGRHEAILGRALGATPAPVARLDGRRAAAEQRARAARRAVRWGAATGVLAAAAAAALALWPNGSGEPSFAPAPSAKLAPELAPSRSTQALFDEPFARSGGSSARIDRIARARSSDLRQNRFRRWGVP